MGFPSIGQFAGLGPKLENTIQTPGTMDDTHALVGNFCTANIILSTLEWMNRWLQSPVLSMSTLPQALRVRFRPLYTKDWIQPLE